MIAQQAASSSSDEDEVVTLLDSHALDEKTIPPAVDDLPNKNNPAGWPPAVDGESEREVHFVVATHHKRENASDRQPLRERLFSPGRMLLFFTLINFINYVDRGIVAGLALSIQNEFGVSDTHVGVLSSAFMVGYVIASLAFGYLSSVLPPSLIMGGGLLTFSVAEIVGGASPSFYLLLFSRTFVGVGEASFVSLAPVFIDNYAPKHSKTKWLAFFYMSLPLGAAAGFVLAGFLAVIWWRLAFLVVGLAMLPPAIAAFWVPPLHRSKERTMAEVIRVPAPGHSEGEGEKESDDEKEITSEKEMLKNDVSVSYPVPVGLEAEGGVDSTPMQRTRNFSRQFSMTSFLDGLLGEGEGSGGGGEGMLGGGAADDGKVKNPKHLAEQGARELGSLRGSLKAVGMLLLNVPYILCSLGYAAYTFFMGALSYWGVVYMVRQFGEEQFRASIMLGIITLVTAVIGTAVGGILMDFLSNRQRKLRRRNLASKAANAADPARSPQGERRPLRAMGPVANPFDPYVHGAGQGSLAGGDGDASDSDSSSDWLSVDEAVGDAGVEGADVSANESKLSRQGDNPSRTFVGALLCGGFALLAFPIALLAVSLPHILYFYIGVFIAETLLFAITGPINAALLGSLPIPYRVMGMSLNILIIHLGGDVPSPIFVGLVADVFSIKTAMIFLTFALLFASVWWFFTAISAVGVIGHRKRKYRRALAAHEERKLAKKNERLSKKLEGEEQGGIGIGVISRDKLTGNSNSFMGGAGDYGGMDYF